MRGHWVWNKEQRKFVDYVEQTKEVNAPFVITDDMPALKHMANGKFYTSKARFREVTRQLGYEEVGDQTEWRAKPDPAKEAKDDEARRETIAKAYYAVRDGMAPLSELDKERCKIINKQIRESRDNRELNSDGSERK